MRRVFQVSALLLGLTGCSLTIDPNSVPPPAAAHTIRGQLTPGAGLASAAGGHSVARGTLGGGTASAATPSGHSISQGTISP